MAMNQDSYNLLSILLGIYAVGGLILLAILVLYYMGQWKTFKKLGLQPWACLIPVYSTWVLANRVTKRNMAIAATVVSGISWLLGVLFTRQEQPTGVRVLISLVALVSFVMTAIVMYALAQHFGFGPAFAVGLLFLPPFFFMYLGFSKVQPISLNIPAGLPAAGQSSAAVSDVPVNSEDNTAPEDNSPFTED